jgi:quinol monooxygenase YgiN
MSSDPFALLVLLHPPSTAKRDEYLAMNKSLVPLFHKPSTNMPTRAIFTPSTRPKASLGMVKPGEAETLIGLVEIWESAGAMKTAVSTPEVKAYLARVPKEGMIRKENGAEMTRWAPARGFVSREEESPKAEIVMLAKFVVKGEGDEAKKNRDGLVAVLGYVVSSIHCSRCSELTIDPGTSATGSRPTSPAH